MAIELELELELDSRRNDNHDDDDDAHKKIHFLFGLFNCHWRRWMNEWMNERVDEWRADRMEEPEKNQDQAVVEQIEIKAQESGPPQATKTEKNARILGAPSWLFWKEKLPEGVVDGLVIYLLVYFQHFFGAFIRSCSARGSGGGLQRGAAKSKRKYNQRNSSSALELKIICKSNWKLWEKR